MTGKTAVGGLRAGVEPFVEQLAAPTAAPGGGSASAAAGAMAAALAHMVASMSRGKKNYAQYERELSDAIAQLARLREELKAAIESDADAYYAVVKAYKDAKQGSNGNEAAIGSALRRATEVPLSIAELSADVGRWVEKLRPITNPKMASDLTVAAALSRAAVEGALANVEINLESQTDQQYAGAIRSRAGALRV
jgi:formiminotetrahydrofolate cyclodeaminase